MYRLTKRQRAFLLDATTPQKNAFLSKGPAEAGSFFNINTGSSIFRPAVRGVLVSHETFADAEAAGKVADEKLAEYLASERAELDEIALGISDHNRHTFEACDQATVRVDKVFHLGAMLSQGEDSLPDELEEFLEELADGDHPYLELIDLNTLTGGKSEDVVQAIYDESVFGFLVQAATPVREKGESHYSWGCYATRWFYGETFEEAIALATKWATERWEKHEATLTA